MQMNLSHKLSNNYLPMFTHSYISYHFIRKPYLDWQKQDNPLSDILLLEI